MQRGMVVPDHTMTATPTLNPCGTNFTSTAGQFGGAANLAAVTQKLLQELRTTKKDIQLMQNCLKELGRLAKSLGSDWNVRPFGSAATGFCTRFSDLDVTCFQKKADGVMLSPTETIFRFHTALKEHASFEVVECIACARIPILRTRYEQTLDVDISFQNTEPLANTYLLRSYSELSLHARQIVILIKLWAKAENVCGAQNGHLSSYSLTLMAIYFLQVDPYIKMPCFPTSAFNDNFKLSSIKAIAWDCPLQITHLICRFFDFYATHHCWGYEVVSPRVGERIYASDPRFAKLSGRESVTMIHIEDPFLLSRNLNCVLRQMQQDLLFRKMQAANIALQHGEVPQGFVRVLQKLSAYIAKPLGAAMSATTSIVPSSKPMKTKTGTEKIFTEQMEEHVEPTEELPEDSSGGSKTKNWLEANGRAPQAPAEENVPVTALMDGMTWSL